MDSSKRIHRLRAGMISIMIHGDPAPQGSKKFVGMRGGKGLMIESSKKVKPWRQDVVAACVMLREEYASTFVMLDGPIRARMVFTLPKPASAPKRKRTWADKKPDLSKLLRSTEDALVTGGIIRDDARIVEYSRAAKVFAGEDDEALQSPGVWIQLEGMA